MQPGPNQGRGQRARAEPGQVLFSVGEEEDENQASEAPKGRGSSREAGATDAQGPGCSRGGEGRQAAGRPDSRELLVPVADLERMPGASRCAGVNTRSWVAVGGWSTGRGSGGGLGRKPEGDRRPQGWKETEGREACGLRSPSGPPGSSVGPPHSGLVAVGASATAPVPS